MTMIFYWKTCLHPWSFDIVSQIDDNDFDRFLFLWLRYDVKLHRFLTDPFNIFTDAYLQIASYTNLSKCVFLWEDSSWV